ncbi:MAG: phosphoribosylanthranilate isomerase [Acidobacteriaceae bacterium]
MWIKICGNTNLDDARHAIDAGADALGFVFAPSPRRVTCEQVASITALLPAGVEKYGVFGDAGFDEILAIVYTAGLTGVQLHGSTDTGLPLRLRTYFAAQSRLISIVSVLHFDPNVTGGPSVTGDLSGNPVPGFEHQLTSLAQDHAVDAALVDSRTANAAGGTGLTFNWQAAQTSFLRMAPHLRIIAAGGLRPENVAEAIHTLRPWGVDVVTGVEASPGRKDHARVTTFIRNAKEAFALQSNAARTEAPPMQTR